MIKRIHILFLILSLVVSACIEPYEADIEEDTTLLVIDGSLVKGDSIQKVLVSTTTSLLDPRPRPMGSCEVIVLDDQERGYQFYESETGTYSLHIPDEQLVYGRQYKVRIISPDGKVYESEYEMLNAAAEVDEIYYSIEDKFDAVTGQQLTGVQFYIDILAPDEVPRYFRWNLEETYEYTTGGPITYYYDLLRNDQGEEYLVMVTPDNPWEFYRCWITEKVPGLYLSNTINLTVNEKKKIPLHYVSTERDRMKIRYNLLVKQYSMNEGAYNYWLQNKTTTEEGGGLYTEQPAQPLTNLCNVDDNTEMVIGYFWVSTMKEKRIVVPRPNDLIVPDEKCSMYDFDPMHHLHPPWPVYIRVPEFTSDILTGDQYCFLCTARGGSLTPPDFWE